MPVVMAILVRLTKVLFQVVRQEIQDTVVAVGESVTLHRNSLQQGYPQHSNTWAKF